VWASGALSFTFKNTVDGLDQQRRESIQVLAVGLSLILPVLIQQPHYRVAATAKRWV